MDSTAFVVVLFLTTPIFVITAWTLFFVYSLNRNLAKCKLGGSDVTIDHIIADIRALRSAVSSLKAGQTVDRTTASSRLDRLDLLVAASFKIMRESIENDLTQDEALEIIKGLNLGGAENDK